MSQSMSTLVSLLVYNVYIDLPNDDCKFELFNLLSFIIGEKSQSFSMPPLSINNLPPSTDDEVPGSPLSRTLTLDGAEKKIVNFEAGDMENPKNWSKAYKWYCTMVVAVTCFVVAFCSAVITADIGGVSERVPR